MTDTKLFCFHFLNGFRELGIHVRSLSINFVRGDTRVILLCEIYDVLQHLFHRVIYQTSTENYIRTRTQNIKQI